MGCNCGGSGRPAPRLTKEQPRREAAPPPRRPRTGGVGQAGYYYTGPRTDKPAE